MLDTLTYNWWMVGLRGLAAVVFGILAFLSPGITLTILIYWFGVYVLWDGIFGIMAAIRQRGDKKRWWALLLEGLVGVIAAIAIFLMPGITALALVYLIAAWALITGVFEIAAAIRLRKEIENEWFLILSGVVSVLFSILLIIWPGAGVFALVWVTASYSLAFGLLLIFLAVRLRTRVEDDSKTTSQVASVAQGGTL